MLKKKLGCALVALAMVASSFPAPALAAVLADTAGSPSAASYTGADGAYTFEKLSHPNMGVQQPDGIVDYLGNGEVGIPDGTTIGQGDRGQSYAWSALAYGDDLYIGTCYAAMGNTLSLMSSTLGDKFDKETMEASLKAMFNGTFYYGHDDGVDSGGILVKLNTKTGELKLLMSQSSNGIAPLFRNGVVYNGKLYFCGSVKANGRAGLPSVYQIDPETDEFKAVYVGLSSMQDYGAAYKAGISTGIRGMCVYDGQLIISNVYMDAATGKSSATILASSNPSAGQDSFTQIGDEDSLFGYPAYRYADSIYGGSIWDMTEYNGHLYATICTGTEDNAPDDNTMQSFALVRGDKNADGSFTWTPIAGDQQRDGARYTFGIDPARTRAGAANLMVYNGYLYIGEYNDEEIALERIVFDKSADGDGSMGGVDCSFVNANLEQSVNLYRMDQNENMELVVGDATDMFPNGSLSGLGSGWGRSENQYVWRMTVYDGKLYIGTFDTSSLLEPIGQFSNGDIIRMSPDEWESQIQYLRELIELLFKSDGEGGGASVNAIAEGDDAATIDEAMAEGDEAAAADDAATTDDAMAADLGDFLDELESAQGYLSDTDAVALADEGDADYASNIEDKIQYHQQFADYYEALLKRFEELEKKYELPENVRKQIEKLLNGQTLEDIKSVIKCLEYMKDATRGFDLYVTDDGVSFDTVTVDGFGDPYNHGLRTFAATSRGLCIGTANPFNGTQVWIQRGDLTLSYDANGGSLPEESAGAGDADDGTYAPGAKVTVKENPYVRGGYEFAGWNTAADGTGESCEPGDEFTLSESTTLYAQWKQKDKPTEPTDPTQPTDPSNPGGDNGNDGGDTGNNNGGSDNNGSGSDSNGSNSNDSDGNAGSTQQAGSDVRKGGSSVPKTGDNSGATLAVATGAAALGALCVVLGRKKRGENE